MQCSSRAGYLAYSLLIFLLSASPSLSAQTPGSPTEPANPPAQQSPEATPPADSAPAAQSSSQTNYPNAADRTRLAREAQERVRARRAARTQAIIDDTYSHKYDLYFGYAYLRFRPGHDLQHTTEYGWNAGITRYFNSKLGLTIDLRGYYSNAFTGHVRPQLPTGGTYQGGFKPFISNYSVMAGPQYFLRKRKNYAVSANVLGGVTRNLFYTNSAGLSGTYVGLYPNETRFNASANLPVDINLGPGLAIRIAPSYNLTTFGGDLQHNLGFTTGLNYRFGK